MQSWPGTDLGSCGCDAFFKTNFLLKPLIGLIRHLWLLLSSFSPLGFPSSSLLLLFRETFWLNIVLLKKRTLLNKLTESCVSSGRTPPSSSSVRVPRSSDRERDLVRLKPDTSKPKLGSASNTCTLLESLLDFDLEALPSRSSSSSLRWVLPEFSTTCGLLVSLQSPPPPPLPPVLPVCIAICFIRPPQHADRSTLGED